MPDLKATLKEEAQDAKRDPGALQSFRALRLNQGVADSVSSVLIDVETWKMAAGLPLQWGRGLLSTQSWLVDWAKTCRNERLAAAYFRGPGRLEAVAAFPGASGIG